MGTMINRRRVMGGKSLPYDAEVEYLQSTGTQVIDTGIKSGPPMESIIKVQILKTDDRTIVGSRNPTRFYLLHAYDGWSYGLYNLHSSNSSYDMGVHVIESVLHEGEQSFTVDERIVMTNTDSGTFKDNTTVRLFNSNISVRLYSVKLYKLNVLIADFIPVRIGTTGYMYDKVSKQLFSNVGTGEFKLGLDKNRSENITYITTVSTSSSTPHIDVTTGKQAPIVISHNTVTKVPWTNGMVNIQYVMGFGWKVTAVVPCICNGVTYNEGDIIAQWRYNTYNKVFIEAIV